MRGIGEAYLYEREEVVNNLYNINKELEEERKKPDGEYSRERELKLIERQLMEGIKLSAFGVTF